MWQLLGVRRLHTPYIDCPTVTACCTCMLWASALQQLAPACVLALQQQELLCPVSILQLVQVSARRSALRSSCGWRQQLHMLGSE
jgi:hypothetical protein